MKADVFRTQFLDYTIRISKNFDLCHFLTEMRYYVYIQYCNDNEYEYYIKINLIVRDTKKISYSNMKIFFVIVFEKKKMRIT